MRRFWICLLVALCVLGLAMVRTAWLSDDAYITLRTLDHFFSGYGLRWNVAERVQAYTHPLWMLILLVSTAVTGEMFYTTTLLSVGISLFGAGVLLSGFGRPYGPLLALGMLVFSKTFLSFSTSGLENPLLFVLLVLFAREVLFGAQRLLVLSLLSGLCALCRMDALLLVGPTLGLAWVRVFQKEGLRSSLRPVLVGFAPFFAWEVFSLFYYGAAIPNTAYAKLGTGIPRRLLIAQGLRYAYHFFRWDPVGALVMLAGMAVGIRRFSGFALSIALSIGLSVVYVIGIGGDFMCGRFFTPALALSLALLSTLNLKKGWGLFLLLPLFSFLPLVTKVTPTSYWGWMAGKGPIYYQDRVADERIHYYPTTGLLAQRPPPRKSYLPNFGIRLREEGKRVVIENCIGMVGYYAGPTVHIIDNYALADPLLARLKVANPREFRIGHFRREVPAGYVESVLRGQNSITDPVLFAKNEKIWLLTRADLVSRKRLLAILEMNLGL